MTLSKRLLLDRRRSTAGSFWVCAKTHGKLVDVDAVSSRQLPWCRIFWTLIVAALTAARQRYQLSDIV